MPALTGHTVYTDENSIVLGQHFYTDFSLPDSLCGYALSLMDPGITNASHPDLLSAIQSFATFWNGVDPNGTGQTIGEYPLNYPVVSSL